MKVIDLSHKLTDGMQVFPGDMPPRIEAVEEYGFRSKNISISSHTGTHIDAPAHALAEGATLDALPCATFFGSAAVADVSGCAGREIEIGDIAVPEELLSSTGFLLLRTGYGGKFGSEGYMRGFPVLSAAAAEYAASFGLKGLGVDAISVDPIDSAECPVHKILLRAGMVIIENLRGLEELPCAEPFFLTALPLPVKDADGAPARVIAALEK